MSVKLAAYRRAYPWWGKHGVREVLVIAIITSLLNYSNRYVRYSLILAHPSCCSLMYEWIQLCSYNSGSSTALLAELFDDCNENPDPRFDIANESITDGVWYYALLCYIVSFQLMCCTIVL
jgi:hypothetical protein